jgi:serine/threonine protein kinase
VATPLAVPTLSLSGSSGLAPPQAPDELGRLGRYRVLRELGRGGMGVVYAAEDPVLKRQVALKAMLPEVAADKSARQRFLLEANAVAALDQHDHIVAVYEVDEDRGVPFLVMPLLKGETLETRMKREPGPLPVAEVLRIGREIALGLAAAHAEGLIHRDVKMSNVWLEQGSGRVKILDFGLVRSVDQNLTQLGQFPGTIGYMAPEQAKLASKDLDRRCDLFSLGVVLYRLSTGKMPFQGETIYHVLMATVQEEPECPGSLNPLLPPELVDLIEHLLAKDREQRPGSATEVAHTLQAIELPVVVATKAPPAPGPSVQQKRLVLVAAIAGLLLLGVGPWILYLLVPTRPNRGEPPPQVDWLPQGWEPQTTEVKVDRNGKRSYERLVWKKLPQLAVAAVVVPQSNPNDPQTFYIMENKVWNDLYRAFIDSGEAKGLFKKYAEEAGTPQVIGGEWEKGAVALKGNAHLGAGPAMGRCPVFGVKVTEAHCFAEWLGGRLPTRQQWRKAAGWKEDTRAGPFDGNPANRAGLALARENGPWPVDEGQLDKSIYHCRQMASNGWEWTRDLDNDKTMPLQGLRAPRSAFLMSQSYINKEPLLFPMMNDAELVARDCTEANAETTFRVVLD